ncbi:endolytic transglycosylase MltG [Flavobacterium sp.]|uniref:endolytic transglycosylase MltG n=1 Tax=Flavobacterium sp. TaxID=239 RepID=UPI0037C178C2
MNTKLKTILIAAAGLFLVFAIVVYAKYFTNNTKDISKEFYVEIPTGSNYDKVLEIISPYVTNTNDFKFIARLRSYDKNVKPGRFLFKKGLSSFGLVSTLRRNVPVNLAFNNQERLENLCVRISSQIEPDTTKLLSVFRDSLFLKQNGFTKDNVIAMFIPNSYEFYWNVSAEKFRDKMLKEYQKFWTLERLMKAKKLGLSPVEVMTLASIVHKETVKKDERPKVAKVYLNRLEQGMPLQADPTIIYAVKLRDNDFDQIIKRVLYADLTISSPYNTYVNIGLPPGPIAMPDITAIDAVLTPDNNDYIYFCASVERFGYHEFASTYPQHQVNAKKYADWLNGTGTKR